LLKALFKFFDPNFKKLNKYFSIAEDIEKKEDEISSLTDKELRLKTEEFKEAYQNGVLLDDLLIEAFAVVREAAKRVIKMRHFKVQLVGGIVLHYGDIAEMKTGEGKTLVCTLPAYLNALTGKGVHIVTVNDYLAKRDRYWMGQVFEFLGLTVGLNLPDMSLEEKRLAYLADITYGTNNEFGFDYLRDNMVLHPDQLTQRGLHYAIIDEVDSILIDEARTPLIISGQASKATDLYYKVDKIVRTLKENVDYTVDIKYKQVALTEEGSRKVEAYLKIDNLYDMKNINYNHHVQQALKAHILMKKDEDYVVNENGVVIVDEFTGRLMEGRRYSDGLHQAIEAKEGLKVQRESMTLATITLQNYFRLYDKLAGMTGTAKTEEEEFRKLYNMDVIQVPTNKPNIRVDLSDVLYRTEEAKFKAVVEEIKKRHKKGQPILVGTISIEKSEKLSKMLFREGIPHQVLNAKNHEREADIIARAGQKGTVTIATNMAGRGTDIVLGEGVAELGGLHVIGTERHESRRIDNQLRGRAGRQGDPGSSQFFLSLSDDLLKRFGAHNLENMMQKLGIDENQPIEGRIFTKAIENAQKKVEGSNFDARRWVLQYDDVLNQQRGIIYKQRKEVLTSTDLEDTILTMARSVIEKVVKKYTLEDSSVDVKAIISYFSSNFLEKSLLDEKEFENKDAASIIEYVYNLVVAAFRDRKEKLGAKVINEFSKVIILRTVDRKWIDHIDAMEHLRQGIHLRAYGQDNPLLAYQFEGFAMFEGMVYDIQEEVVKYILKADIRDEEFTFQDEVVASEEVYVKEEAEKKPVIKGQKIGRNEPCPCGSGLKYKNCCLKNKVVRLK